MDKIKDMKKDKKIEAIFYTGENRNELAKKCLLIDGESTWEDIFDKIKAEVPPGRFGAEEIIEDYVNRNRDIPIYMRRFPNIDRRELNYSLRDEIEKLQILKPNNWIVNVDTSNDIIGDWKVMTSEEFSDFINEKI